MAINSVAVEWERCAEMMFEGVDAGPVQREEMRKAFYAGAWLIITTVKQLGGPQYTEEQGLIHLQLLEDELQMFVSNMMKEYIQRQ